MYTQCPNVVGRNIPFKYLRKLQIKVVHYPTIFAIKLYDRIVGKHLSIFGNSHNH
jgi:hypothetical protein